jgi:hypothetical protein
MVGEAGAPGSQLRLTTEPPGLNCAAGGERIDVGVVVDGDFDVQQTAYVCNGAAPSAPDAGVAGNCEATLWTQRLGTPAGDDDAFAVATDTDGNVYMAGRTQGLSGALISGDYAFLAKFDPDGSPLWTRQFGTSGGDEAFGVAASPTGQVYVTGVLGQFGPFYAFLDQFDVDGNLIWTRQIGSAQGTIGYGVTTDGTGNVYIAGETSESLDGAPHSGGADLFVARFDVNGNQVWTKQLGSMDPSSAFPAASGRGVATDPSGNVYVTGFTTSGSFDGNASSGGEDIVLVKLDANGNKVWSLQHGTSSDEDVHGIAADDNGGIYVTGRTYGNLDGNTGTGAGDLFVVKYDAAGDRLWTSQHGAAGGTTVGLAVAADSTGVFVTGETSGNLDGNMVVGDEDSFVVKFGPDGTWDWSQQSSAPGADLGTGVATDGHGGVFDVGATGANVVPNSPDYDAFLIKLGVVACGP